MKLTQTPDLHSFFTVHLFDADPSKDEENTRAFIAGSSKENVERTLSQAKILLAAPELPIDELGSEANRWFSKDEEARAWLSTMITILETAESSKNLVVKDAFGAILLENDSVQVIKDLKVKGGASDLKRGTLIKKIRLVDDAEVIECRVDGSTLVLKTCFLKKV